MSVKYPTKMKALIFCAGMSRRLGALTENLPKSCLPLYESETILDRSLQNIASFDFEELILVIGHEGDCIRYRVNARWLDKFKKISFIENDDYINKNNIYTAFISRDYMDDGTFIFNSDIVYDRGILEQAVDFHQKNARSFLVVDSSKALIDEDMKVLLDPQGKVLRINKNLDNKKSFGEYIGIMHVQGKDKELFKKSLENMIKLGNYDKYYEDALDQILADLDLACVSTNALGWTEIDTVEDYQRARELACVKSQYQMT